MKTNIIHNTKIFFQHSIVVVIALFISNLAFSQGTNCASATPFCSNAALTFPNTTSNSVPNGPNYGCLNDPNLVGMQNPSWHYLNISQAGSLQISMTQAATNNVGLDLDFAMWGPYTSTAAGCAAIMGGGVPPIQCSSDPSNTETIGIGLPGGGSYWSTQYGSSINGASTPPPAQAGEFYIVVITNASNSNGNITFSQTGGTGSTNCAIVQPCTIQNLTATAVCSGNNATISGSFNVSTGLTTGTLTVTSSCGGSQTFNPPFPSTATTLNYSFNGGPGDGSSCTITTSFSANTACSATASVTKPTCGGCTLTVNPTTASICQGNTTTVTANENGGTWSSSNTAVATVNNGVVTGVALGTAIISYKNGTCTATTQITVSGQVTPTFTNPGPICGSGTFTLPTTSNNGVTGTWSPAVDNTQTTIYTFTPTAGSCATSTTMQVDVVTSVSPIFTNLGPICAGTNLSFPITSSNGITGTWSPALDNTQTTTYTFTPNPGQCASDTTMQIIVDNIVTPFFDNPGPICANETFTLPTTSINGIVGVWTPAINNTQTTIYTFMPVTTGCATATTMTVIINSINSTTTISATETNVIEGETTNLNVTLTPYVPGILYAWSPTTSLNCTNCPNPIATPTGPTWYVVTMTTPEGCSFKDSIFVNYKILCGDVYIPNIFTPNQDGNNDILKPYGRCLSALQFSVFDRWGNRVFYTDEVTEGWDGTFKGKLMNSGVFVYRLTATLLYGEKVELKGNVTLVR